MKAPKGSKARRLVRRWAVRSPLDRTCRYATRRNRPGGSGDRRCHAGGDGAEVTGREGGGDERWEPGR